MSDHQQPVGAGYTPAIVTSGNVTEHQHKQLVARDKRQAANIGDMPNRCDPQSKQGVP